MSNQVKQCIIIIVEKFLINYQNQIINIFKVSKLLYKFTRKKIMLIS